MIKEISPKKIKIKNLIGIITNPVVEDFLYEIISFLKKEGRVNDHFTKYEVGLKTHCRVNSELLEDLKKLVELGFLEHKGWTKYKVIDHPWK